MEQNKETKEIKGAREEAAKEKTPELTTESLAMEVLKQEQKKSRVLITGLVIGLAASCATTITTTINSRAERENLVRENNQNNREWRKLFSDYDFISQDGEGINNVSRGTQGDLNNGAKSENEKER